MPVTINPWASNSVSTAAPTGDSTAVIGLLASVAARRGGSIDVSAILQAVLDLGGDVVLPKGSYRVDTMLVIPADTALILNGSTLTRVSAATDTTPVVHLKNSRSKLMGGTVISQKASPDGVVLVGHRDATSTWNTDNSVMRDVWVKGVQSSGNIGVKLMSSQPYLGPSYSSYFHTIDNVDVRGADQGIFLAEKCNSNQITGCHFWDCMTSAITLSGCYANKIEGGFVHTSTNGVVGVLLLNHGSLAFSTHHADNNAVDRFGVEPGGASSRGVVIGSSCTGNMIIIMGNVSGGNTISNENNLVFSCYGRHQFPADRTVKIAGRFEELTGDTKQITGTCGENVVTPLVAITLGTRKSVLVEVELIVTNANLDNPTVIRKQYAVKNIGGTFTTTDIGGTNDGTGATIAWSTGGGVATLNMTSFNNGTATTYTYGYKIAVRGSTFPTVS